MCKRTFILCPNCTILVTLKFSTGYFTRRVSFDIKSTRQLCERLLNLKACQVIQHPFMKPSLANLISKDAKLVFYLSVYPFNGSLFELEIMKNRSIPLCQTCVSQILGLCRSDHPFPNIIPIFHCISNLSMSNSVSTKPWLYFKGFSFPKISFLLVYHCLC